MQNIRPAELEFLHGQVLNYQSGRLADITVILIKLTCLAREPPSVVQLIFLDASRWNVSLPCSKTLTEFPAKLASAFEDDLLVSGSQQAEPPPSRPALKQP